MALETKTIQYQFYDTDGNYVSSLTEQDFVNVPEFTWDVNGGLSELRMKSAFKFSDWNYPADGLLTYPTGTDLPDGYTGATLRTISGIDRIYNAMFIGNTMKVFVKDKEGEAQIWSGIYAGIELEYRENGEKDFIHHFIPNITQLGARVFRNGSNTTVSFASQEPADIFKAILNSAATDVTYNADSIKNTSVSRTYEFPAHTCLEALQTAIKLTPSRWVWFIGGDDLLYLRNIDTHGTTHRIPMSSCKSVKFQKSIAFLRNKVLFLGGGSPQMLKEYNATGSQNAWGVWEERISDERVSDTATAQAISSRFLADRQGGTNYFFVEVMDSNFSQNGFDIESVKPGDQIIINSHILEFANLTWGNFTWGVDYWKYDFYAITGIPGVIQRINYKFDSAVFECSFNFENQDQRIEDINRDLTNYRFKDAPDVPS
jgi:hypothetical protein